MEFKSEQYLTRLFDAYVENPGLLPEHVLNGRGQESVPRLICDHISGMTDRYAISEYRKLFDPDPDERDRGGEL